MKRLCDEIQRIASAVTPLLNRNQDDIHLNEELFQRIKSVYGQRVSGNVCRICQQRLTLCE